jgi:hypothetical protein
MTTLNRKVRALQKKSAEKGHWAVAATAIQLLADESSLDARINLVGSMHEVGLLKNSLQPYWTAGRDAGSVGEWTQRCVDRLRQSDHDYWALAGLLGLPMSEAKSALAAGGYKLVVVRYAESYKQERWHIATFCGSLFDATMAPVIEVGWSDDREVVEASRWRAVILEEQAEVDGGLAGKGFGSYYMRASLPYGCWRIHEDTFEVKADWVVSKSKTILHDYT